MIPMEVEYAEQRTIDFLRENGPQSTSRIIEFLGSDKISYVVLSTLREKGKLLFFTTGKWGVSEEPELR